MPSFRILTLCVFVFLGRYTWCWTSPFRSRSFQRRTRLSLLRSTPFEASFYDNPYDDTSTGTSADTITVPSDTRLVLGINKYSHDTTICAADAETGKVLFAISKERISRRKHDSGNAASVVECCLEALNLDLDSIEKVVVNNHHHRVIPLESNVNHMEWESGLRINGGMEDGYEDPENLLPDVSQRFELSHHLAHAYSTATQAPFNRGLCVVMDGMGETYRSMLRGVLDKDLSYVTDLSFGLESFRCIPEDLSERAMTSYFDWREAESVYVFKKNETSIELRPVFKRFTEEKTPPTLYNHGFENMDSVGALYSRASSHIFGDWNACGKVMGLAPWAKHKWMDENGQERKPELYSCPILEGHIYDDSLVINRTLLEGLPHIARTDPDLFDNDGSMKKRYDFDDDEDNTRENSSGKRLPPQVALEAIALASRIQTDTETVLMDFVDHFKGVTGETNLCLAGGVALNSVLNGRLARELGFERTFVSPYPGDDGVAVGCCAYGLYGNVLLRAEDDKSLESKKPPVWNKPLTPYLGQQPSDFEMKSAVDWAEPWVEFEVVRNEDERLELMVREIESGGVVAWYHSRVSEIWTLQSVCGSISHYSFLVQSEMGPRALGHRSILADPRKKGLVRFINEHCKSRESFRPFAPSVLEEESAEWFDLGEAATVDDANVSPYMSMTAMVRDDKRAKIPAVTHVDGSSRLQTVTKEAEPLYHKLISKFFDSTGVPLVLNTSFNTLPGEPIVETARDAIRSFLYSMGSIEILVLGDYVIKRKKPDLRRLLGETTKDGDLTIEPVCPVRTGPTVFQSSVEVNIDSSADADGLTTTTKVRMPDRPLHGNRNEWFELLDDLEGELLSACDGTATMNDIMAYYTAVPDDQDIGNEQVEEAQNLLQNIVQRLVRLYEHTLISW